MKRGAPSALNCILCNVLGGICRCLSASGIIILRFGLATLLDRDDAFYSIQPNQTCTQKSSRSTNRNRFSRPWPLERILLKKQLTDRALSHHLLLRPTRPSSRDILLRIFIRRPRFDIRNFNRRNQPLPQNLSPPSHEEEDSDWEEDEENTSDGCSDGDKVCFGGWDRDGDWARGAIWCARGGCGWWGMR